MKKGKFEAFKCVSSTFELACGILATGAAVEGQSGSGVEFLNQKLGQGDLFICFQGFIPILPVQHQVFICVRI